MSNKITVAGVLRDSWQSFTDNLKYIYYLMLPAIVLSAVAALLYPKGTMDPGSSPLASTAHLVELFSAVATMLATVSLLSFIRAGRKDEWMVWKSYLKLLPKYIGVCILQGLILGIGFLIVISSAFFALTSPSLVALTFIIGICFILVGTYVAIRFAFVGFRALEHPTESIKNIFLAEAHATEGNRWTLFGIFVILLLLMAVLGGLISGLLTGILGPYYGAPLSDIALSFITPFLTVVGIMAYTKLTNGAPQEPLEAVKEEKVAPTITEEEKEAEEAPQEPSSPTPDKEKEEEAALPPKPAVEPAV